MYRDGGFWATMGLCVGKVMGWNCESRASGSGMMLLIHGIEALVSRSANEAFHARRWLCRCNHCGPTPPTRLHAKGTITRQNGDIAITSSMIFRSLLSIVCVRIRSCGMALLSTQVPPKTAISGAAKHSILIPIRDVLLFPGKVQAPCLGL